MTAGACWTNWAGTASMIPRGWVRPASIEELAEAVQRSAAAGLRVKAVGAGHSFTDIAVTDGTALDLSAFTGVTDLDTSTALVTVRAGTGLRELNDTLWSFGLGLTNLGDIDVQTIAGAISTGTHGTGRRFGGLATQVRALTLVRPDGSVLTCSTGENADIFACARVGLGALGVIATVTLQCEPAYLLAAQERPDRLGRVLAGLDEWVDAHDHTEFYWFPHTDRVLTKTNTRLALDAPPHPLPRWRAVLDDEILSNGVFEVTNRIAALRPAVIPAINSVAARALSARSFTDRSYRVFASPRRVRFREMEYALPRAAVPSVLASIQAWLERSGERIAFPVEVRFAAADDIPLSTASGRDSGYVAVHQYHRRDHRRYFDAVEAIARAHAGRPHWGKLHGLSHEELAGVYPRMAEFLAVRNRLDPQRWFGNGYLTRVLGL